MNTRNKNTGTTILALIGSSILTLASLLLTGTAGATTQSTATFTGSDAVSQGNWQGKYGVDGYSIANGAQNVPSYASFTVQNAWNWTWAPSTTDTRALQVGGNTGRIASAWYTTSTFTLDVNLIDGQSHQVALYAVDWDERTRSEAIQIIDANSGAQLDTRSISGFTNGIYLIWNISGHVKVNVTYTGGSNAVVSGIFFSSAATVSTPAPIPPTTSAAATFLNFDTATGGNWPAKYGTDGYSIASGTQHIPSYATFTPQNQLNWTWISSTSDPCALQAGGRPAAVSTWYNNPTFSFDVNVLDGQSHQFSVYALDWDCQGRAETLQIVDANSGSVLDARSVTSFTNGVYLVWNITGHVKVNVTVTSGPNAVVSGVFFGGSFSGAGATASFVKADSTTQGNWPSTYGVDGYAIANVGQNIPSYAAFAVQNQLNYTWTGSTSDARALLTPGGGISVASTWYNNPNFSFDINLTDGKAHQIALYALDWDCLGRGETVQMVDANNPSHVLDTEALYGYSGGTYLVWNISGHVTINIIRTGGANAVISGVFFGSAISNLASNNSAPPIITTQPASQTVAVGRTATFSIANTGTAPMAYQWNKNGVAISGATSSSYTTPVASISDNGSQFSASVSNTAGSAVSNVGILTVSGTYVLNTSSTSVSFGGVNVSSSSQQNVTLTNAGTANLTISNVSLSGAGFNASGLPIGTILAPGQTASVNVTFAPAATGNSTGSLTVTSNASNGAAVIALSGAGVSATHSVVLSWSPSMSTVAGYNVYVSTVSGSSYAKLTSSPVSTTGYTDFGLQTEQTRYYVVTSVDSANNESVFSNEVSALIP